ncbi:hypothetical protein DX130_21280 [Paenibacillus paeoniae]|uniref:Zinc ribbon domain-containing protein n=1 Tax=Paenibacillus paeoniae TaxID=2292705 RepID=A0A371P6M6_9BACL|nr:hypothetical protein DX130_21280 [Paenibacillus paeoniae]
MRFLSYILIILGIIYAVISLIFTLVMTLSELGDSDFSIIIIVLIFVFYIPTFALLYFGYRIQKNLRLKMTTSPQLVPQPNSIQTVSPVQQRVETRTVSSVIESRPAPPPKKAVSVSVECKGCGARKAVIAGESSTCDYCGSPLTVRG